MERVRTASIGLGMLALATVLVACGGSGSDSAFKAPTIASARVSIDATNQYQVADAADNGVGGAMTGGGSVLGVVVNGEKHTFSAYDFAKNSLLKFAPQAASAGLSTPLGVEISNTVNCAGGGTMTVSVNINDPDSSMLQAGDSFGLEFDNCVDTGDGTTSSGSLMFTVSSGMLDYSCAEICGTVTISVDFDNLRVTEMGKTDVVHGGLIMSVNGATSTLSGSSLYVMETGGEAGHLTNFTITSTTSGSMEIIDVDLTIASTDINGTVTVKTDPADPLLQMTGSERPYDGTLIITGGTTVLSMDILGTTSVNLTLDANGDGMPDSDYPLTVSWTEIDNGAALP
jgi:hypothetical protein